MKRAGSVYGRLAVALSALSLAVVAVACEEDGKTVPERCSTLPAPFDIQNAGAPSDDNRSLNPGSGGENGLPKCVTEVGHAVSSFADGVAGDGTGTSGSGGSGAGGSASSGSGGGGSSNGGSSNGGDTGTAGSADAGAGGA